MSSINFGSSVPGVRSDRTYAPKAVLWTGQGNAPHYGYLPTAIVIDGTNSRDASNTGDLSTLQPGMLMGKATSGSKYRPAVLGVLASAAASAATGITVSAAVATEIARRVGATGTMNLTGPPTAAGTVASIAFTYTAVNTSTGVIAGTVTAALVTGSLVRPNDGSETPLIVLDDYVRVTDIDGNAVDAQTGKALIEGALYTASIINYPADASLKTWLKAQLNTVSLGTGPGPFKFDDNF